MSFLRPALIAIVAVLTTNACIQVEIPGAGGINPPPPRAGPGQRPPGPDPQPQPVVRKRVAQKEPVATLIANDGTWCTVSEERYRMIKVGDNAWCAWTGG